MDCVTLHYSSDSGRRYARLTYSFSFSFFSSPVFSGMVQT
jgi:hypothetical protein